MSQEIDLKELEEFNILVDNIIDDIENGKIKSNPLTRTSKETNIEEISGKDLELPKTVSIEDDTQLAADMGFLEAIDTEEDTEWVEENTQNVEVSVKNPFLYFTTKKGVTTIAADNLNPEGANSNSIKITNPSGNFKVFINAPAAAKTINIDPTTVRERCKKNYIDTDNNTWDYLK